MILAFPLSHPLSDINSLSNFGPAFLRIAPSTKMKFRIICSWFCSISLISYIFAEKSYWKIFICLPPPPSPISVSSTVFTIASISSVVMSPTYRLTLLASFNISEFELFWASFGKSCANCLCVRLDTNYIQNDNINYSL